MKVTIILLVAIFSLIILDNTGQVFSLQTDSCQANVICVHPGDMLKYNVTSNSENSTLVYKFSNLIDSSHIKLEQNQTNKSDILNNFILNLKTGYLQNEKQSNMTIPFIAILASPVTYNKSDASITPIVTEYNGFKRTALDVFHSSENSTTRMEYDSETGILLDAYSAAIVTIGSNPEIVDFSNKLIYTNMINSDSASLHAPKSIISIPTWVKNTSKWWSQDQIQDSEFTNSMQYLITTGIMQIPHDSAKLISSKTIPVWIKHDAGWWADGQISDEEFVKGIQWLISNGIIQV
jgi:hypothetical protein